MKIYNDSVKSRASMAQETAGKRPRDNLDLDVMNAERLGYGCHYGNYKADHPYTKATNEANAALLCTRQKETRQVRKRENAPPKPEYERVCPVCGQRFTTRSTRGTYCSEKCKRSAVRERDRQRKEAAAS